MNDDVLMRENSALLTLLQTHRESNAWNRIANDCVIEGSAERILMHEMDPVNNPLQRDDADGSATQGVLPFLSETDVSRAESLKRIRQSAHKKLLSWQGKGFDFVSVFDPRFPERLRATIDVPPFLFAKGELLPNDKGVSIIGSRDDTPEGDRFAVGCAHMLVGMGLTVVAGLADGIDAIAHETALRDGGRTVAFIGTGIDRQYPAKNRVLQHEIEERGLVLSQFLPGTGPTRHAFLMRNALMSGYGIATIIAEAGEYSGTRNQARHTFQNGRPIIINRMVLEKTRWARELADKPNVSVVADAEEAASVLRRILDVDENADNIIESAFSAEWTAA